MRIILILISLLISNCAPKPLEIVSASSNLKVPQDNLEIEEIKLNDVHFSYDDCFILTNSTIKVYCITEENLIKDISNMNTMRVGYNRLLQQYKNERQYLINVIKTLAK